MPDLPPAPPAPPPSSTGDADATAAPVSYGRLLWPLGLSLLVTAVIGYFTFEPGPFRQMLHRLDGGLMLLALGTVVVRVLFGGWRLNFISHGTLGLWGGLRGQLAWDFFSNVTPSTVGGGPVAAAYIAKDQRIPLGEATAFILFSILLDQIWFAFSVPTIFIASLYLEVIPASLGRVGLWSFMAYFAWLLVWVALFGYATLVRPDLIERVADRVLRLRWLRRFRPRVRGELRQMQERAHILRTQSAGFYLKGFALTFVTWIARYALIVLVIWSVYPELDKLVAFFRSIALTLGSLILPTPGGSGGLEGLYALLMAPLMPQALVAPTVFTWRVLGYYIFIALGAFLSMHHIHRALQGRGAEPPSGDGLPQPAPPVVETEPVE